MRHWTFKLPVEVQVGGETYEDALAELAATLNQIEDKRSEVSFVREAPMRVTYQELDENEEPLHEEWRNYFLHQPQE